jgi:L-2-hydroxyglutarate oxidase LhgO
MSDIDKFMFTIIGAGAIGLAIARRISEDFKEDSDVLVIEKEKSFGRGISSRNSEVVHSGIYYPTGSLKHTLCVHGRRLLYDYCERKRTPYNKCGKLIVATEDSESEALEKLYAQVMKNEIENVVRLDGKEARELEPDINVVAALFSKETGIFDTHSFMKALEGDITRNNGIIVYGSEVISIRHSDHLYYISLADGTVFASEYLINSAGLYATSVSKLLGIEPVTLYPCKGTYFSYMGRHRCRRLIYPVPHKSLTGLGVHATIDLGGRLKFGPDAEYVDNIEDFAVDKSKKMDFYLSAKKMFKDLDCDQLFPDMAGIRPKIQGPDDSQVKDFYIKDEKNSGFPKFVNLLGMESPGLTGAIAIGEYVYAMLKNP